MGMRLPDGRPEILLLSRYGNQMNMSTEFSFYLVFLSFLGMLLRSHAHLDLATSHMQIRLREGDLDISLF